MRPLVLTMTAFGPYRDAETIDFRLLGDKRLFVISGNTGAGKTTIFDAICYALYDAASGEDRAETRLLRSHFAAEDVHTSVDFAFAVGKRTFRIFRQMKHRKGANKSETGDRIEFYETTTGQEVPAVDRFMVSEVNEKVKQLLGLTKEQFSQIVMLPQGEFRKLLTSDTDNKEEVLRHIFQTYLFERVEGHFQQKSKELKEQYRLLDTELAVQMKQVLESLPQREESKLWHTLGQDYYLPGQVMEGLAQERDYYEQLHAASELRKAEIVGALQRKEEELRTALARNERFAELAQSRARLQELEQQKAAIAQQEARLEAADRASRIVPFEDEWERLKRELAAKRQQQEQKQREVEALQLELANAEQRFREEEARDGERKQAEQAQERLAAMAPIVLALEANRAELEALTRSEAEATRDVEALDVRAGALRAQRESVAGRIAELEAATARYPATVEALEQLRAQQKLLDEQVRLEQLVATSAEQQSRYVSQLQEIRAEHDRLEQLWIEGQAGLLAVHLHDGSPCPVCGSENHPHKATTGEWLPSRDKLQAAKDKLRTAEAEASAALAQVAAARDAWERGAVELAAFSLKQGDALTEQLAAVNTQFEQARQQTEMLKRMMDELPTLRQDHERLSREWSDAMQAKEQALAKKAALTLEIGKKRSLLEKELEPIPDALRTPEQLAERTRQQERLVAELTEAFRQAAQRVQELRVRYAEAKAGIEAIQQQCQELDAKRNAASHRLEQELTKAQFSSLEAYQAAHMSDAAKATEKEQVTAYHLAVTRLSQRVSELMNELEGKAEADVSSLEAELASMKAKWEKVQQEIHAAIHLRKEADRLLSAIAAASASVKQLEAEIEQVQDLYLTLKGDNPLKISFERYILIEYLEQILHAANIRLAQLSSGQFTLERSDRLEMRGKQSGLGLDVYDAYTGQRRDVKSLSGGEKFHASLCLALGMTDVIQAHQGGVSIEMMFIDEGFGSLDEDALNKAIGTLIDLQRTGRIIGVISHVQELKLTFPAVLEVHKTKEGYSKTNVVVK